MIFLAVAAAGALALSGCQKNPPSGSEESAAESTDSSGRERAPAATDEDIAAAGFTSLDPEEGSSSVSQDALPDRSAAVVLDTSDLLSGIHHAIIEVEDFGPIYIELDADQAPITVTNFVKLAQEGFYDGLTFHRVVPNFMIQGGDPNGNGTGGSSESIKGEFPDNGVENNLTHTRGTISMARTDDPDSATSQFFIMHQNYNRIDGGYAAFGHVTEGIEVVDAIVEYADTVDRNPQSGVITNIVDQPLITTILIID